MKWAVAAGCAAAMAGCAHEHGHGHGHGFADANEAAKRLEDPARDEWQRPDEVVRALELTPAMHVADVGAGTGYFSVRLARAVPQGEVVATDIEPNLIHFLTERAQREHLSNLRATLATPTRSGLAPDSADRILIVHVWHHLDHRAEYARDLAAALRPTGKLFIVDFTKDAERGPPPEMRITPEAMMKELTAAGLTANLSPVTLPGQYIVEAHR